jgi:hypothetical protein
MNVRVPLTILTLTLVTSVIAQDKIVKKISDEVTKAKAEAHLTFLASDEMRGRDTGSPELAIAANYLASQFKLLGLKTVNNAPDYFQPVGLSKILVPRKTDFKIGNDVFKYKDDLVLLKGSNSIIDAPIVFVGYGNESDLANVDVKGKIVVSLTGSSESSAPQQVFTVDSPAKRKRVTEKGGVALIEVVTFQGFPWSVLANYLAGSKVVLNDEKDSSSPMPHLWMRKSEIAGLTQLMEKKSSVGSLTIEVPDPIKLSDKNVIGLIEGTDPVLKNEYIILSAHYDHVGVRKNNSADSIYNGARDNAIGTTAILQAAGFLTKNLPKRSVVIMALCAEEVGLFGSKWYVEHPLIPLSQTVYNLDCDGAGYNDTSIITLIDVNRTTADALLTKACTSFGLKLMGDPVPEQNLYERSDNYNFAAKGIPAVDFAPGIKAFDAELTKYYHQPPDEVGSLDFEYLVKFFRSYVYSAHLIANDPKKPYWKAGDKFEAEGNKLYGK